jgi:predicted DNA-binding transcriptional regulator AlpA
MSSPQALDLARLSIDEITADFLGPEAGPQVAKHLALIARALYQDFIVDWAEAMARTSLSKRTIQRLMQSNEFPQRIELSGFRSGWRNSDLDRWIKCRPATPYNLDES